jgi:hypothetical protein
VLPGAKSSTNHEQAISVFLRVPDDVLFLNPGLFFAAFFLMQTADDQRTHATKTWT